MSFEQGHPKAVCSVMECQEILEEHRKGTPVEVIADQRKIYLKTVNKIVCGKWRPPGRPRVRKSSSVINQPAPSQDEFVKMAERVIDEVNAKAKEYQDKIARLDAEKTLMEDAIKRLKQTPAYQAAATLLRGTQHELPPQTTTP